MMKLIRNRRGVTLVEMIVVIALVGLVISASFSLLSFGNTVHKHSIAEFEIQSSARLAAENINRITRYASATFTIPESSFREDNLTDGWSYVGILDGSVVLFEYGNKNGVVGHHKNVIAEASDVVDYEIVFKKAADDHQEKIVGFSINGFIDGKTIELDAEGNRIGHINITSQSLALNSLQVIHKGTTLDPAVAIAFRKENRDNPEIELNLPVAQVAMVLDVSGSMEWRMNGTDTNNESQRRITLMKNSANKLVNNFAASDYPVEISLVPFSTTANNPRSFRNASEETAALHSIINSFSALGGTNTGDGIRRAYHQIISNRTNPDFADKVVSDYMIILVDGVTTFASVQSRWNRSFVTSDGNVDDRYVDRYPVHNNGQIAGNGSDLDATGEAYVQHIGNIVQNDGNIKVYVIGFSSRSTDFGSLSNIATSTGAEPTPSGDPYFEAGDEDELDVAFGEIHKEIINDLWHIDGPNF